MASKPHRSPGDLSIVFPEVPPGDVGAAVSAASTAARDWARTSLAERAAALRVAQAALTGTKEELARGIALEVGKPITEALGEVGAVIAKIELTIADAERHLAEEAVTDGPHPAAIRRAPRGPAAVIAPFNFPLHLGHGAAVAYLLAGNPVLFKPSPYAAHVCARYAELMQSALPPGVFSLVQGGAAEGQALCCDPRIRAVCFTGSMPAGRALARALANDFSKDLALELGGSNAVIVAADADLAKAATAVADGMCLTAGQRCNATARILVEEPVAAEFVPLLLAALAAYEPGDPLQPATKLGPVISAAAVQRFEQLRATLAGEWLLPGGIVPEVAGKRGHYVRPALVQVPAPAPAPTECFLPLARLSVVRDLGEAVAAANATPFGLTASVFTRSQATFQRLAAELQAGNVYANLPTTFSPSTLPFGGWGESGNGRPGGRGFIRFTTREQAVQWAAWA